jgi:hypothetical protein
MGSTAASKATAPGVDAQVAIRAATTAPVSKASGLLRPGALLRTGHAVRSPNKRYTLLMQTDGNLVLYRGRTALWGSGTEGHPGASALMQTDGNLVIYSKAKTALWNTATYAHNGAYLAVQNDGNLVIYGKAGKALWWRAVYNQLLQAGEILKPGQAVLSASRRYTLLMQTDGNLVLYRGKTALWSSVTGGNPGGYAAMQTDGNLVVYSASGTALWSSVTGGNAGAHLAVQDDGNLVMYSKAGKALWWRNIYIATLPEGYKLDGGQAVVSANREYFLTEQTDGNLVLYKGSVTGGPHKVVWAMPAKTLPGGGAYALMQTDGNFVVYSKSQHPVWSTATAPGAGAFLAVQNDGNLVLYSAADKPLWSTGT